MLVLRGQRALLALTTLSVVSAASSGCVTLDIDDLQSSMLPATSVIIPLEGAGTAGVRDPVAEYYRSVMLQLHDAVLEGHPERLRVLCDQHDRGAAPAWAREQIGRFRQIADVLEVEQLLARTADLEFRSDACALGERVPLRLVVPTMDVEVASEASVRVGEPVTLEVEHSRFAVDVRATDFDCLGGRVVRKFSQLLSLPSDVTIGDELLDLPFDLSALAPEGTRRELTVSVTLLPGNVDLGGVSMPNRRVRCVEKTFELLPIGSRAIREAPLRTLQNALASGESRHLEHVCLATRFMPEEDVEAATRLLIEHVRFGRGVRARACMAALQKLTGSRLSVDDREGWLRWWAERQGR